MYTAAGHRISQVNGVVRTVLKFSPPLPLILSTTPFSPSNFTIAVVHRQAEAGSVNYSQAQHTKLSNKNVSKFHISPEIPSSL